MWAYLDDFSPDYMIEYILVSRRADLEASREAPPQLGTGDTDSELESELAHLGQELERYSYEELREEYGKVVTENIQRGVYEVDLFYWARLSYWTPDEAAALASGYEPRIVTRSLISNLPYHRITQHYNDLWEHIRRAQEAGRGLSERMTPSEVLGWAETNGVEYPDSLVKAVSKFGDRGPTSLDDLPSCIQQLKAENERLQRQVAELEADDQSLPGNKLVG
jgi:hypothetical protein